MTDPARANTLDVYVSSTWLDLQPERTAILAVTHRLRGLHFRGMEFFGSRDEATATASVGAVDGADAYIGIVGHRYGSGITEQEYARAQELGIPAFIYFKEANGAQAGSSEDAAGSERLDAFRRRLRESHTCSVFHDADDLAVKVAADLHNWMFDRHLSQGLARMATDYSSRVQAFIAEYLGNRQLRVPFGGRGPELDSLDRWLRDIDAPPSLLITAGAGKGKSALLVRWMSELLLRPDVALVFFPVSIRFRTNLASVVFPSLATCLAALHDEPLKTTPDTPPEVWRGLVTDLLARPLRDGRQLVLIVDGLDEAADWTAGADLFPSRAGPGARIVVAARLLAGDVDAGDWLRRLGWDAPDAARTLTLAPLELSEVADVLERMGLPLSDLSVRSEVVYELHRLSAGEPLIVRLYVDDLRRRGDTLARLQVEDLRTIEPGLGGFFERWWQDQRGLWGSSRPLQERHVQVLMNVLASALGPLTRDDLFGIAAPLAELNTWTLEEALEPLQRFIVGDGADNGYVYSHPGLAIHFRDRLTRKERELLDDRLITWCRESVESAVAGPGQADELSAYVLQYFGAHLDRRHADVTRFAPLLTDTWRRAWHAHDGSYAGYRADLRRIQAAAAQTGSQSPTSAAETLPLELRAALCCASVDQLAANTPPELVVALVEKGVWNRSSAVGYARLIRVPERRAKALVNVASVATEAARPHIAREALAVLAEVAPEQRVPLLTRLAPLLPTPLVEEALDAALAIPRLNLMVEAIVGLSPYLPTPLVPRTLEAIDRVKDQNLRQQAFRVLAADHARALEQWAGDPRLDPLEQAWILAFVSDAVDTEHAEAALRAALSTANRLDNDVARLDLLIGIAERLPEAGRRPLVDRVRRDLIEVSFPSARVRALLRLVPLVGAVTARDVVREILETCPRIQSHAERAAALAAVAPHLIPDDVAPALALVHNLGDAAQIIGAGAVLFPHLSQGEVDAIVARLDDIEDPFEKLCAAAPIASHLGMVGTRAVQDLEWPTISPLWRFRLVQMLAAVIPVPEPDLYASDSLAQLAHFSALSGVCQRATRQSIDRRIVETLSRSDDFVSDLLSEAVQFLAHWAATAPDQSLAAAVDAILEWRPAHARIAALDAMASQLPAAVLEHAVRRLQRIGDEAVLRETRVHAIAHLPPARLFGDRADLWTTLSDGERVTQMLQWLQDGSGDSRRLRHDIVELLSRMESGVYRARGIEAFARAAGAISDTELQTLLEAALAIEQRLLRSNAISSLLPDLQAAGLHASPVILAALIHDNDRAADAAAAIVAALPADDVLQTYERLAGSIGEEPDTPGSQTFRGLVRLLPRLELSLRRAAIDRLSVALSTADAGQLYNAVANLRNTDSSPEFFDRCFELSQKLLPAEHLQIARMLLPLMTPATIGTALRSVFMVAAADRRAGQPAAGSPEWSEYPYASWRVNLVVKYLDWLHLPEDEVLASQAYEHLLSLTVSEGTTPGCIALLPLAGDVLAGRLVDLALRGLHKNGGQWQKAEMLQKLEAAISCERCFGGANLGRCVELLDTVATDDETVTTVVARMLARLPGSEVLRAFGQTWRRELRGHQGDWGTTGSRLATLLRIAESIGDAVCSGAVAELDNAIRANCPWDRADILRRTAKARGLGPRTADGLFGLVAGLHKDERLRVAVPLLRSLGAPAMVAALRSTIAWIEALPRTPAALLDDVHQRWRPVVTRRARRAAIILEGLSALEAGRGAAPREDAGTQPDADAARVAHLAAVAFDDLESQGDSAPPTDACLALLPFASPELYAALVTRALAGLSRVTDTYERAAALATLAVYVPVEAMSTVVDEVVALLELEHRASPAVVPLVTAVGQVIARGDEAHARRLLTVARGDSRSRVLRTLIERLPDSLVLAVADLTAQMFADQRHDQEPALLSEWAARLARAGTDRLADLLANVRPRRFAALVLAHTAAHAGGAGEQLKAIALDIATTDPELESRDLLRMDEAAGGAWPALESLLIGLLLRDASPLRSIEVAAELIPNLSGVLQQDVVAAAGRALALTGPDPEMRLELPWLPPLDILPEFLGAVRMADESARCALLLPFVAPAQRAILASTVTRTPDWLSRSDLYDAVIGNMSNPGVARAVTSALIALPPAAICTLLDDNESRARVLRILESLPPASADWHSLFVHLIFSIAEGSRGDLMRLLQSVLPAIRETGGPVAVERVIESLDTVSAWWP